jgi:hypothetical protein
MVGTNIALVNSPRIFVWPFKSILGMILVVLILNLWREREREREVDMVLVRSPIPLSNRKGVVL